MQQDTIERRREAQAERVSSRHTVAPRVDIYENADEFRIQVDLPGVAREQLQIDLDNGQLVLHAERTVPQSGTALTAEFGTRAYHRVFAMPRGIDVEKIGAELEHGVLTLRLPKSAAVKPRRIDVKTS